MNALCGKNNDDNRNMLYACRSDVMCPGNGVVNSPFVNGIKVSAGVKCAEVGPEVAILVAVLGVFAEGKDANVTRTHQVDSDSLEAVVCSSRTSSAIAPSNVVEPAQLWSYMCTCQKTYQRDP